MATILPVPPERVWPWLVQMGGGRAGWYSWDWLDNNGEPSADRVVLEWQNLEVGRHLKGPTNWWIVVALEPNRTLGAAVQLGVADGPVLRSAVWSAASGVRGGDLGFHLQSAAGGRTRLVIRTRSRGRP
jgi:hypothetical protein